MTDRTPSRTSHGAPRSQILLAFAALYIIWGSTYLAILLAIKTLPPFLMVGTRFLVAGIILYSWVRLHGEAAPTRIQWRSATIVGFMLLVCGTGVVVWAEERVPSGIAALLVSVVPLWMVLIQWSRPGGTRPNAWVAGGVALGLAGLWFLTDPLATGEHHNVGVEAIILVAALSWAAGSIYSKTAPLPDSKFLGTSMEMLAAGVILIALGLATGEAGRFHPADVSVRSWLALAYLITFGSIIAFTAYVWLLGTVSATLVSTYAFVNPVVAVILGWAIAGEQLNGRTVVAAAIIIGAVALITIGQQSE